MLRQKLHLHNHPEGRDLRIHTNPGAPELRILIQGLLLFFTLLFSAFSSVILSFLDRREGFQPSALLGHRLRRIPRCQREVMARALSSFHDFICLIELLNDQLGSGSRHCNEAIKSKALRAPFIGLIPSHGS